MKNKKGFTLIEVMIVVAILGILFALIMGPGQHKTDGRTVIGGSEDINTPCDVIGVTSYISEGREYRCDND